MQEAVDTLGRPLRNLRLSVTDRCNLRCAYCMPEDDYVWLPRGDVLHFEEISTLVDLFLQLGVDRLRLTGGEPLLRRDLPALVGMLSVKPGLTDLALTTNGVLLAGQIDDLLRADRFVALARFDELARVQEGIAAAYRAFGRLKLDSVVIKGVNDDELIDLIEYGKGLNAEIRFIEYMDVGGATRWSTSDVVSRKEMLDRLSRHYGTIEPLVNNSSAPADQFTLPDGTVFGVISSTTQPFCRTCDRSRLTADGMWYLCLYASRGIDLRGALRRGASVKELTALIRDSWVARDDRGAEERLALGARRATAQVIPVKTLRQDPHLEMHTRGG